jgi:hypothetical protein
MGVGADESASSISTQILALEAHHKYDFLWLHQVYSGKPIV